MRNQIIKLSAIAICSFLLAISISAQTTAFTYQGSLNLDGTPSNGNYDFVFALFDAASGGTQIAIASPTNVPVSNGLFSLTFDFGAVFPGASRFMEIRVRPAGGGAFTTLSPRQEFRSAPYAIKSITAENALQLAGVPASTYVQSGASTINAGTEFRISNLRVLSTPSIENTFVGINAGAANTTSSGNTFVGNGAGQTNTNGGSNTFVGARAGRFSLGGSNTAVGFDAGGLLTTGAGNSIFGTSAGNSITSANNNSIFGTSAGQSSTTGIQNSMFGAFAGFSSVTGQNSSFFGYEAGRNTTANGNSFFGSQSGLLNTTGTNNSFFGVASGGENTLGSDNAFFGVNAGRGNTTGIQNTFIGRLAGRFNLSGDNNTFVGYNTANANTFGSNNTIIGANANLGAAGLDFATAIGAGATVTEDNTVVVGRTNDKVHVKGNLLVNDFLEASYTKFGNSFTINYSELTNPGNNNACWGFDEIFGHYFGKCVSSIRFKTNVNDYSPGIDLIHRLRPVTFDWKSNGTTALGLIAEEVNEVEPLLAVKDKDGEIQSVRFDGVTVVLVNAVKEQQAQIERLEKTLNEQKDEIVQLKLIICEIKPNAQACLRE